MNYSPKLKVAMEEIKAILLKHDIAGTVVLHTDIFSEYLIRIDPSYSCAKLDARGESIQILAKRVDYSSAQEMQKHVSATANMFKHLADVNGQMALTLINATEMMDAAVGAFHEGGKHTPQNEIDN